MGGRILKNTSDRGQKEQSQSASGSRLTGRLPLFLASGILTLVASPSYGFGVVAWCCLIPFLYGVWSCRSWKPATLGGFLAGAAFFGPGVYWLNSVTTVAWVSLFLYCSIYWAVFGWITYFAPRSKPLLSALVLASSWILLEFIRAIALTGFPYLLLSHTQQDFTLLVQSLDAIGSYGLSGVIVAVNVLVYGLLLGPRPGRLRCGVMMASIFAVACVYGSWRLHAIRPIPTLGVAAVQASVPQEMKEALLGKYDPAGVLNRYLAATESIPKNTAVDLLVWPETVVLSPYILNVSPEALNAEYAPAAHQAQSSIREVAASRGTYFLVGATSYLPAVYGYVGDRDSAQRIPAALWNQRYNSAYLFDAAGRYAGRYDKIHLVPFGEYVPLPRVFPFLSRLVPFTTSILPGKDQPLFHVAGRTAAADFGVLICYEDTDAELARRLRRHGADFLVNISNDAWFGESELDQHFVAARFRAIENRIGVVRVGNNGITAVIDPLGRVPYLLSKDVGSERVTKNVTGYLLGQVATSGSVSIYTRLGDWPAAVGSLLIVGWWVIRKRASEKALSIH